jgi:predicted peroxiredoxin
MGRLLVHITTGPEGPTRAALGMLVARSALDAGHDVDLFFAGDAVALLREPTMAAASGIGTGNVREHYEALVTGGARIFASGLSAVARELSAASFEGRPIELAKPDRLVELAFAADRVLTY